MVPPNRNHSPKAMTAEPASWKGSKGASQRAEGACGPQEPAGPGCWGWSLRLPFHRVGDMECPGPGTEFSGLQAALAYGANPALCRLEAPQQELSSNGPLEGICACPPVPMGTLDLLTNTTVTEDCVSDAVTESWMNSTTRGNPASLHGKKHRAQACPLPAFQVPSEGSFGGRWTPPPGPPSALPGDGLAGREGA